MSKEIVSEFKGKKNPNKQTKNRDGDSSCSALFKLTTKLTKTDFGLITLSV